jgi:hypothetical protein
MASFTEAQRINSSAALRTMDMLRANPKARSAIRLAHWRRVLRVLRSMHPERASETHLVPPAENQQFAGSSKAITSDSSQTWSETLPSRVTRKARMTPDPP